MYFAIICKSIVVKELTVRHISENGRYILTDNEGSGTRELYMWSWSEWMFEERK